MADRFGKFLTGVLSGAKDKQAPGHSFNAAERHQREVVLLDDGGPNAIGTTVAMASLRGGDVLARFEIVGSVSLAAVTASIGTRTNPTKYANAVALGAANVMITINVIDAPDLPGPEEIFMTTGGAVLPTTAAAKMQMRTIYTHK